LVGRRGRQQKTIRRQDQRRHARHGIGPRRGRFQLVPRQAGAQHRAHPLPQALRMKLVNLVPVHQNKGERPRRQHPAQRAAQPHQPKFLLRILEVRESNGIHDRQGWHIQQAMYQHQAEERPERPRQGEPQQCQPADAMTERQEFFGRKVAVAKLVAKEHPHDGRERKRIQNASLLPRRKTQAGQVAEDERQPRAPDEKLQQHHDKQFGTGGHNSDRSSVIAPSVIHRPPSINENREAIIAFSITTTASKGTSAPDVFQERLNVVPGSGKTRSKGIDNQNITDPQPRSVIQIRVGFLKLERFAWPGCGLLRSP